MKKSDYRKFQIKTVTGNDDFASMREVIQRRYKRLLDEKKPFPSLIVIDGGLGQLGAAYDALEEIGVTLQPLASIAKKEEIIYVHGQEDEPIVLERRSPVLHLMQKSAMSPTASPSPTTVNAARYATSPPSWTTFRV